MMRQAEQTIAQDGAQGIGDQIVDICNAQSKNLQQFDAQREQKSRQRRLFQTIECPPQPGQKETQGYKQHHIEGRIHRSLNHVGKGHQHQTGRKRLQRTDACHPPQSEEIVHEQKDPGCVQTGSGMSCTFQTVEHESQKRCENQEAQKSGKQHIDDHTRAPFCIVRSIYGKTKYYPA